jgi:cob(I)alamin adenosyltransferase
MKIYTRTGDSGETGLFGGGRVAKDDPRMEACGAIDEANALVGLARSFTAHRVLGPLLDDIQHDLFDLGADIATPLDAPAASGIRRVGSDAVSAYEASIDRIELRLTPIRYFVLPGGGRTASAIHAARATVRRAERRVIALGRTQRINADARIMLNRLSDLLFVLARYANKVERAREIRWKDRSARPDQG